MKEMKVTGVKGLGEVGPTIISSQVTDEFNLIDVFFETNPIDAQCDQRVRLIARPLQIVYDSTTILRLIKVFSPPSSVNLSELEMAASEGMANFKERSATGMQHIILTRSVIDVDIKFLPNIFIMPLNGYYNPCESSAIVVSLGELHITSDPHTRMSQRVSTMFNEGQNQAEILERVMQKAYDKYTISLKEMQVVVSKPNENWEECIYNPKAISEMHLLRPTTFIITADVCVVDDDPRMPKQKIDIVFPAIDLNITEDRIMEAMKVALSIPLPENESPQPSPLMKAVSSASLMSVTNFLNQEGRKSKRSSKNIPDQSLTTEVVQYTSLEVNFALKHFGITLFRSCGPNEECKYDDSTESSPTDEFATPVDDMNVLQQVSEVQNLKILSLQILNLEAHMAQRTFELVANAK